MTRGTCFLSALAGMALFAPPVAAAPVPFVGCPSDGQLGRQPRPRTGTTPDVSGPDARRLAYYQTIDGTGVLAPRGWTCLGTMGSNGSSIVVAPHRLDWRGVATGRPLAGQAVVLRQTSGSTSGRFAVAEVAARLFPAAADYVRRVEAEGMTGRLVHRRPPATDRLTYRGAYQLLYTTPRYAEGLGTRPPFARGALPVDGVEWLHPDHEMDLTSLAVRLSAGRRPLVADIIAQATPPPPAR